MLPLQWFNGSCLFSFSSHIQLFSSSFSLFSFFFSVPLHPIASHCIPLVFQIQDSHDSLLKRVIIVCTVFLVPILRVAGFWGRPWRLSESSFSARACITGLSLCPSFVIMVAGRRCFENERQNMYDTLLAPLGRFSM